MLAIVYLAGIASVGGALLAGGLAVGGLLTVGPRARRRRHHEYQFAVTGLTLIVAAIVNPEGLTGAARRTARRVRPSEAGVSASQCDRRRAEELVTALRGRTS